MESRRRQRFDLQPPAVPELGEAVQQNDQRPVTGLDVMQPHVADLGIALTNSAEPVSLPLLFRHPARAAGGVLGCAHCPSQGVASGMTLTISTAASSQGTPWWVPWSNPVRGPGPWFLTGVSARRARTLSGPSPHPSPARTLASRSHGRGPGGHRRPLGAG